MTDRMTVSSPGTVLCSWGREYYWRGHGPLSIKTFSGGHALYEAAGGTMRVDDEVYLVLNDDREYSITIDAALPVESFCVFFDAVFAVDAHRSLTVSTACLLDDGPAPSGPVPEMVERTYPHDDRISPLLRRLRHDWRSGTVDETSLWDPLFALLARLVALQAGQTAEQARLPALRATTRDELYRRLHLARDYADAFVDRDVTLDEMARVAALSPTHLLRTFKALFGETPHQYVMRRRLERAMRLLRESEAPLGEIPGAVGWESVGSFGVLFQRRVGMTPGAYRRHFR
jgi:AraC family transcriptional regulator